jgi:secernin
MAGDLVVALGKATIDGQTLFGQNSDHPIRTGPLLCRTPGREFAPGEKVRTQFLELSQVRHSYTALGCRPDGWWGYSQGVNDQGLAIGGTGLRTRTAASTAGLTGGDVVRLVLERCRTARHAVDLLTDLVERHGQSACPGKSPVGNDYAYLIADSVEAFAVETAGRHWVHQEIRELRAVSNVSVIRQDWDKISHGLAGHAIDEGWWPGDGSKLDFAGTLSAEPMGQASGMRRWGRATYLLEHQNGHIDTAFVRRLLGDHYEGTHFEVDPVSPAAGPIPLCRHGRGSAHTATAASWIAQLSADPAHLPIVWCAFGPPCRSVYFPIFLEGELPAAFTLDSPEGSSGGSWPRLDWLEEALGNDAEAWARTRNSMGRVQARLDAEAEEFAVEGAGLKQRGEMAELRRLAALFMQNGLERFEAVLEELAAITQPSEAWMRSSSLIRR